MATRGRGRGRGRKRDTVVDTDVSIGGLASSMASMSLAPRPSSGPSRPTEVTAFAQRPGFGSIGERIPVITNYFEISVSHQAKKGKIFQYDIQIILSIMPSKRLDSDICRHQFWLFVEQHPDIFINPSNLVYDDQRILFSKEKLLLPDNEVQLESRRSEDKEKCPGFSLKIRLVAEFDLDTTSGSPVSQMAFHFLNNLSTQGVRYPSSMAEQYLYPFKSAVYWIPHSNRAAWKLPIGPGMEIWRGLQSTVTFGHNRKLMLNADVVQKAFYIMDFPIIDFYLAVLNEGSRSQRIMYRKDMSRETCMDMRQRDQLSKALKGLKLKLVYASSYTRFVDVFKPANVVRFRLKRNDESESVPLTVEEYFYRYRGIRLNFPNLPVIQCGSRSKQIYIPMELLNVSDRVQRVKRNLNPFQLQKASRGCVLNPHDRFRLIYQMLCESFSDIGEGDSMLRNFGVTISDNFVHATGRLLPSPQLLMHDKTVKVSSGKWRLSDSRLKDAPSMVLFGAVCVSNSVTIQQFRIPFDNLVEGCRIFGIHFVSNYVSRDFPLYEWQIRGDDTEDINSLRGTVRKFRNEIDQFGNVHINPLLFFIVADVDTFCYSTIKIVCDVEEGIASQVLLKKTLLRMDKPPKINPTIHNVVLKLNTKLGGVNNAVVPNYLEWKMFVNEHDATLFIGIDTTHPSSGDTSSVSVAAIVGSTNIEATRYGASIKIQEMNQERGVYLKDVVSERIIAFFEATCKKPQHIVVFRDGVSNSEFEQIANEEMMGIKASIRGLASQDCNFDPTVSYVVIQKRHQTRFFVENKDMASENGNVPPGTVVDETITSPDLFDFYLCSHFGQIGTSRPAHYTVLYDSWHLSSDQWQQMAYALCHVYARCNRSVSIPAPVYYAHLACVRARCHLRMGSRSSETLPLHEERTEQYRLILDEKVRVKPAVQEMYFI